MKRKGGQKRKEKGGRKEREGEGEKRKKGIERTDQQHLSVINLS